MKEANNFFLCLLASLLCFSYASGTTKYAVKSGDWSDPAIWAEEPNGKTPVGIPTIGDLVIIEDGIEVVINGTHQECDSIIIYNAIWRCTRLLLMNGHLKVHGGFITSATTTDGQYAAVELIDESSLNVAGDVILIGITDHATFSVKGESQLKIGGDIRIFDQNDKKAEVKGFDNAEITIYGDIIFGATW